MFFWLIVKCSLNNLVWKNGEDLLKTRETPPKVSWLKFACTVDVLWTVHVDLLSRLNKDKNMETETSVYTKRY